MDDQRLVRIEGKIDKIIEEQAKQHVTLIEHTRRSTLLEEDMRPVRKHVAQMQGALKLLGVVGAIAGIIEALILIVR